MKVFDSILDQAEVLGVPLPVLRHISPFATEELIELRITSIIAFEIESCWFFATFYDGFKFFKRTASKITKLLFRSFLE